MASIDSRVSAWNNVANEAALDNINRFLADADRSANSPRRQRVLRDPVVVDDHIVKPGATTERSNLPKNAYGISLDKAFDTSSQLSVPVSYATAHSKQSLSSKAPSSPSVTSSIKKPNTPQYGNTSLAPHLRTRLSTTGSQFSSKIELVAAIHAHSDTATDKKPSVKLPTTTTYEELIAAQRRHVIPPSEQSHNPNFSRYNSNASETNASSTTPSPNQGLNSWQVIHDHGPNQTTSKPMNSGTAAKSAKLDANCPCSYDNCSMGFGTKNDLDEHKYTEHEGWCKTCDIDTENDEALLAHKMSSLKHICCQFCGKDFHGEAARNNHELRVSLLATLVLVHKLVLTGCRHMDQKPTSSV